MFDRAVDCSMHLQKNETEVLLTGEAGTRIRPVCARCGDVRGPLQVSLALTCTPENGSSPDADDESVVPLPPRRDRPLGDRPRTAASCPSAAPSLFGRLPRSLSVCGANLNRGDHACRKPRPEKEVSMPSPRERRPRPREDEACPPRPGPGPNIRPCPSATSPCGCTRSARAAAITGGRK